MRNFVPGICALTLLMLCGAAAAQDGPTYAGIVLHNQLTGPVTVPAGGRVGNLAPASGNAPAAGISYHTMNRAIVFVTAGPSSTTCTVGLSGGAVWSAPVSVPARNTVEIMVEDTGGPVSPGAFQTTGFVVVAGPGGPLTVEAGSLATKTLVATRP